MPYFTPEPETTDDCASSICSDVSLSPSVHTISESLSSISPSEDLQMSSPGQHDSTTLHKEEGNTPTILRPTIIEAVDGYSRYFFVKRTLPHHLDTLLQDTDAANRFAAAIHNESEIDGTNPVKVVVIDEDTLEVVMVIKVTPAKAMAKHMHTRYATIHKYLAVNLSTECQERCVGGLADARSFFDSDPNGLSSLNRMRRQQITIRGVDKDDQKSFWPTDFHRLMTQVLFRMSPTFLSKCKDEARQLGMPLFGETRSGNTVLSVQATAVLMPEILCADQGYEERLSVTRQQGLWSMKMFTCERSGPPSRRFDSIFYSAAYPISLNLEDLNGVAEVLWRSSMDPVGITRGTQESLKVWIATAEIVKGCDDVLGRAVIDDVDEQVMMHFMDRYTAELST